MKVTALQIRQSLGKILKRLNALDEPIVIEKGRRPVAVLLSLKTFHERFIDYREEEKRAQIVKAFEDHAVRAERDSLETLRELRYGPDH